MTATGDSALLVVGQTIFEIFIALGKESLELRAQFLAAGQILIASQQ